MRGLNKVMLMGNLGGDPEMRYTPAGKAVTTFSVAANRSWQDRATGEQHKDTTWFNVVAWEHLADVAVKFLHKGDPVYVEGRLQTRSWDAPDGSKRYKTEVVAQEIILLPRGEAGGEGFAGGEEEAGEEAPLTEEDLPF